ncbi:MAG TPA: hypothetical protein VFA26_04590, partial [Gemmataceae bacterium]|nr:hypothetical protein [Gemmataceae bacterium]
MTAAPLPADLALWPDDPLAVLGAPPGADAAALRRACDERLAAFPADQFPEQHRRVCAAYSAALRQLDLDRLLEGGPALVAGPASAPPVPPPPPAPPSDLAAELAGLWQQALAGEEEPAYRQLVAVRRGCPDRPEVYLRLYWLLKTTPDLDGERAPADWLVEGLLATSFADPLWELYRREAAANPQAALDVGSTDLLDGPLPVPHLARLAECRWRAAGRLEQWELINRDLDALRDRVRPADALAWVRLMLAAARELAWGPAAVCGPRLAAIQEEMKRLAADPPRLPLEQLGRWQIRLDESRTALDSLGRLAAACRALDTDHWAKAALARLVPAS